MIGRYLQQTLQWGIWQSGQFLFRVWFDLSYEGLAHLPEPPYLLASNHVSHLDGPVIIAAQGLPLSKVYSLAAQDYFFDGAVKGWLSRKLFNMVPLERRYFGRNCLPTCRSILAQKKIILMFPEGTRSPTGQLQPFKRGLGLLASELNVPVVPVYVSGSYTALPKGQGWLPRRHPIHVSFGAPIQLSQPVPSQMPIAQSDHQSTHQTESSRDDYQAIVDEVYRAVEQLSQGSSQTLSKTRNTKYKPNS